MTSARTRTALALALTGSSLLVATAAHADPACGTPAVEAVYGTVHTAAVTHVEVKWSTTVVDTPGVAAWDEPDVLVPATYKTVTVVDKEAWDETVVDKEAWDETVVDKEAWDETVVDKEAWVETVVDKEAYDQEVVDQPGYQTSRFVSPAIWGTMVEWRFFGSYRYLPLGQSPGGSYFRTGYTYPYLVQPEVWEPYWVPAVTHWVHHPAETHTVDHPAETHVVTHPAETHAVTHPEESHVVSHPEVSHEEEVVDVAEHSVPGEHHDAVAEVSHPEYQWAAESPGEEWVRTDESRIVTDSEATDTQVVLTPAVPAGEACAAPAGTGDGGAGDGGNGDAPTKAPAAVSAASAVPALAHTGADGTMELLGLGMVLVLAGAGAQQVARRRA